MYVDTCARAELAPPIARLRWRRPEPGLERAARPVGLGLVRAAPIPVSDHGTRKTYLDGCTCDPCKAAEAAYRKALRADHRAGIQRLGSVLSPAEARRRIAQIKAEHITAPAIARALGLVHHSPRLHPDGITLRKLLKIRRLHRLLLAESKARTRREGLMHTRGLAS